MFQVAVFTPNSETFKAAPRLCLCDSCLSKYVSCKMFKTYQLHWTQLKANFLRYQYQTELTEDTVHQHWSEYSWNILCNCHIFNIGWHSLVCENCWGMCCSSWYWRLWPQNFPRAAICSRELSTKKGLLFKEESKKVYFFKESLVYHFLHWKWNCI